MISKYLNNVILNNFIAAVPSAVVVGETKVALYTAVPNVQDGVTEVVALDTAYTRMSWVPTLTTDVNGKKFVANSTRLIFPTALKMWGTITHAGIHDVTGNLLFYAVLNEPIIVITGDVIEFAIGELKLYLE